MSAPEVLSEDRRAPREEASRARPVGADERAHIEEALRQNGGNVTATARALGMHRTQLRRLLERHAISVPGSSERDED